jgi:hypothetical protein
MGRLQELWAMLAQRRVGFRIEETMEGTHRYLRDFPPGEMAAGSEHPLSFVATWGNAHLQRFLNPTGGEFLLSELEGRISAGGLCDGAPMQGSLELRYLKDASLRYIFEFSAHGCRFRYQGEKRQIRPWNLHRSHTTCYGTITELESGEDLSDSVVHFNLKGLSSFFGSLRLR